MKLDARLTLFITLVSVFMTCLIAGDLIGGKVSVVHVFGREWPFSAGQLAFPVTFILTDILNEFYGRKIVIRITFIAFAMVGLVIILVTAASALPWWSVTEAPDWKGVQAHEFAVVFSQARRIQIASMFAFITSNLVDIAMFFLLKRLTGNKLLWLRTTGSTAVSQLIDTSIVTALAFGWNMTFEQYVATVIGSYLLKLACAILVTPVIYGLHGVVEKWFGIPPAPLEDPRVALP